MIVETDSVEGGFIESNAITSGDVHVSPFGRGQYVATIRLPDGVTIAQLEATCDELTTDGCCGTAQKAFEFYIKVVSKLRK